MSGGAAAAAAAAEQKRKLQEEEEKLTRYDGDDLDGWEFKIVRANTRKFKNAAAVQQLCDEEAQAGWQMVEKFDDQRIRFKRRSEERARDAHRTLDPYRTQLGASETQIVLIILGVCALGGLAFFLAAGLR
jgi:hypothetical protein